MYKNKENELHPYVLATRSILKESSRQTPETFNLKHNSVLISYMLLQPPTHPT